MMSHLFLAIVVLCVTGCGQDPTAPVEKVPVMPKEERATIMLTPDGGESFVIRLPKGMSPEDVTGLSVELQADKVKDEEGFTVLFQTDQGTSNAPAANVGLTTIFKPLKTGEKFTAYLGAPSLGAWKKDGETWSITIRPQLQAGHPDRRIPDVVLKVTEATANAGKK